MEDPSMDEFDPKLDKLLQPLKEVPERAPGPAAQTRENYMVLARHLAAEQRVLAQGRNPTAGSETLLLRLKGWIGSISFPPQSRQRFSLVTVLATIAIVVGLVFGGAGATVYAAQDSLPGEALYPVKTLSEDVRLELTPGPEAKFQLALALTNRRTLEIGTLIQEDELVPPEVATRLESHMQLAIDLAGDMEDGDQTAALLQLQRQIQDQDRILGQSPVNPQNIADPVLAQLRARIQNQLRLVESGLEDPLQFQFKLRNGLQEPEFEQEEPAGASATEEPASPAGGSGPEAGPGPNQTPGEGQVGPMITQEASPSGEGNGSGPAICDPQTTCEPASDGSGTQTGPNNPATGNPDTGGSTPAKPQGPSDNSGNGGGTGGKKP